ncbi:hypothetical protein [Azospirillum sp. B21]|uniref:hypothetical protein n=1 Tax=Azospirillum sp. B21 TaxID=2607496 RepID=UPI001FFF3D86|nr:hypothetical protein [Azospirillum sp. B21]
MIKMPSIGRPVALYELPLQPTGAMAADLLHGLLLADDFTEALVHRLTINTMMDPSMASRTDAGDIPGIVGSTVAHPADVVRLQVWLAIQAKEWSCLPAALADPSCPGKDIPTDRLAALVDAPAGALGRLLIAGVRSGHGSAAESSQIEPALSLICIGLRRFGLGDRLDRHQVEDDRAPHFPETVGRRFPGGILANELTKEAQQPGSILLLEKEQILSISDMIADRFIATSEGHIALLTFTEVAEHLAIGGPAIVIAMLKATFAGHGEDDRILGWHDDSALALTTVGLVKVTATVVSAAADEVPKGHQALPGVELADHRNSLLARHPLSLRRDMPAEVIALNVR